MKIQLAKLREIVLNFIFPTFCLNCKSGEKIICENCFKRIPVVPKDKLNILSVYEYRQPLINKLLWKLKYHHTGEVAEVFAPVLTTQLEKWLGFTSQEKTIKPEIILIPMPLNKGDSRMHNHAELIAIEISKHLEKSKVLKNLLNKYSYKKQAHTKSKRERLKNVENSFSLNSQSIDYENLQFNKENLLIKQIPNIYIIVDDVTTTGASITNAKYVLAEFLNIPADNILGLTIAH